jgi:hypothetical protein
LTLKEEYEILKESLIGTLKKCEILIGISKEYEILIGISKGYEILKEFLIGISKEYEILIGICGKGMKIEEIDNAMEIVFLSFVMVIVNERANERVNEKKIWKKMIPSSCKWVNNSI